MSLIRSVAPLRVQSVIPASSVAGLPAGQAAVAVVVERAGVLARAVAGGLVECFTGLEDPRDRRGIRHSLASILGLCTAAVLSGQGLLTGITALIAAAGQDVLAGVGGRRDAA